MSSGSAKRNDIRSIDIRLLGSVRVTTSEGALLDLGGPKPRTVLVRLALRPGEVVPTDSLVDTLWGEVPPPTARRSLQAHVAKLRAALGAGDGPLTSNGPGYVLDVPRETVQDCDVELIYTCPIHALSADMQAIVDKARANARRGG